MLSLFPKANEQPLTLALYPRTKWDFVIPHFKNFLSNLELTSSQQEEAQSKVLSIGKCLYSHYYFEDFNPKQMVIAGSYGKGTAIRPPSDIDLLFILPPLEYFRINWIKNNGQSQLLQEVREVLIQRFPRTDLRADGQVIKAPFDTYSVEIVPVFLNKGGQYTICDTSNGGSWKLTDPLAEYRAIYDADLKYGGKATHLIKMLKAWKKSCSVEIKSIVLEIAAWSFLSQWPYNYMGGFFYDWMIRDFFEYLSRFENGTATVPGTGDIIPLGDLWVSRCYSAFKRAQKACEYEEMSEAALAEEEWKKIFGNQFSTLHILLESLKRLHG